MNKVPDEYFNKVLQHHIKDPYMKEVFIIMQQYDLWYFWHYVLELFSDSHVPVETRAEHMALGLYHHIKFYQDQFTRPRTAALKVTGEMYSIALECWNRDYKINNEKVN